MKNSCNVGSIAGSIDTYTTWTSVEPSNFYMYVNAFNEKEIRVYRCLQIRRRNVHVIVMSETFTIATAGYQFVRGYTVFYHTECGFSSTLVLLCSATRTYYIIIFVKDRNSFLIHVNIKLKTIVLWILYYSLLV